MRMEVPAMTRSTGWNKSVILLSYLPITLITMPWDERRLSRYLTLRDLHVLMTVAKCGSMGRAAVQLAVSQPAVSKAIADMERSLGVPLLDRSPRGVETRSEEHTSELQSLRHIVCR